MERLRILDGIRGYAAVSVLFYHAMLGLDVVRLQPILRVPFQQLEPGYDVWAKLWLTLLNGESAVIMFFMLSGCVLIRTVERDVSAHALPRAALAFLTRRVFRIYPATIVCVMTTAAAVWLQSRLSATGPAYSTGDIVQNLLLVSPSVIGASWTLTVEMIAAPFLLAAGWLTMRFGWRALIAFLAFSLVARSNDTLAGGSEWMALHLYHFALGCLVPSRAGQWAAGLGRRVGWTMPLAGFILVRAFLPDGKEAEYLQAACGFAFLSQMFHCPPAAAGRFLTSPISLFLGRLSFGFYLWNVLFLNLFLRAAPMLPDTFSLYPIEWGAAVSVPLAAAALLFAAASERYVERPAIALGRRLSIFILGAPSKLTGPQGAPMIAG